MAKKKKDFIWTKKDGSVCTWGDKLVTHHILSRLKIPAITEESLSRYPKWKTLCANGKSHLDFFSSPFSAIVDGIDGTYFYALNRSFSIWFGLAKDGEPWSSIFVELGQDDLGIVEIAVAEAGRGAWLYGQDGSWRKLNPINWDGQNRPNIGHGIPFGKDGRFRKFVESLSGPFFRNYTPVWTEIVPIGRAVIDLVSGRQQLYSHAQLSAWDWFPLQVFVHEAGYEQSWYRIDEIKGTVELLPGRPEQRDYEPKNLMCLNIGTSEFVDVARSFLPVSFGPARPT